MNDIITPEELTRILNNFYLLNGIAVDYNRIVLDSHLLECLSPDKLKFIRENKFKVAFCCICLNPPYWQYVKDLIEGARRFFLPGHNVDFFLWSDMPKDANYGTTFIETQPVEWPYPTLMRYNLMLQEEEKLKEYDYIFYCDIDMRFMNVVGDEILGDNLTAAPHPGYFTKKELWPPYEPNPESASYIRRPGKVVMMEGKKRFMPFYAAGGFQGGKAPDFIKAMKETKALINKDLDKGYIPIWNDETAWNKYLFNVLPQEELDKVIFLTPSYVYPDSLIKEYYEPKVWGCSYMPKLMTLTKPFALAPDGAEAIKKMIA